MSDPLAAGLPATRLLVLYIRRTANYLLQPQTLSNDKRLLHSLRNNPYRKSLRCLCIPRKGVFMEGTMEILECPWMFTTQLYKFTSQFTCIYKSGPAASMQARAAKTIAIAHSRENSTVSSAWESNFSDHPASRDRREIPEIPTPACWCHSAFTVCATGI